MSNAAQRNRAVYVIERLGWNPVLWAWLAWGRSRRVSVRYADGLPSAIRWWQRRFPIGDFEQVIGESSQVQEAHLRFYDLIEQQTAALERSYTSRRFQRFFSHPQVGRTVRRVLQQDGFAIWFLSLDVERWLARGLTVKFFPARSHPAITTHCARAWRAVPRSYQIMLTAARQMHGLLAPWAIAGARTVLALHDRGVCVRSPRLQRWGIAQKAEPSLSRTRIPDHELIFAEGDLHPNRLLHVVDEKKLSPESRAHFQALGSAVVCPGRLPIPVAYWWKRVCWDFLLRFLGPCSMVSLYSPAERDFLSAAVRVGWHVINCEVFARHHQPRVYFSWDTYDVLFNVRTMVWERTGTRCVGYLHGSPMAPLTYYHRLYAHVLLVAGERIREMFGHTLEAVSRIVVLGHMQTELALKTVPNRPHAHHLVAAFDTSFSPAWGQSQAVAQAFYEGLLALLGAYPSLTVCLKRKYTSRDDPNPAYAAVKERLERHPRLRVAYEPHTYDLLAQADSVIAITISTTGVEALACRKPTLFFDPRPNHASNPYRQYDPFLVCHTSEELVERYAELLAGRYPAGLIETVVQRESVFYDERPLSRVRALLLAEAGLPAPRDAGHRTDGKGDPALGSNSREHAETARCSHALDQDVPGR